jgi:hypothetical protein
MKETDLHVLQNLAGKATYLARLRDRGTITEDEYILRLNELRKEYGLWPIRPPSSTTTTK